MQRICLNLLYYVLLVCIVLCTITLAVSIICMELFYILVCSGMDVIFVMSVVGTTYGMKYLDLSGIHPDMPREDDPIYPGKGGNTTVDSRQIKTCILL